MFQQIVRTLAPLSALAALLASCSGSPLDMDTTEMGLSAAATAKGAKAIASNGFTDVHIIGTDNKVYKYTGPQTWIAYASTGLPSSPTKIAIPYNVNNVNKVYVLAGSQIYSHSTTSTTGSWTQITPQGVVAKDIACGGKTNGGTTPAQLLWKLGTDNYIYRYEGNKWSQGIKAPGARGTETPKNAVSGKLVVDYLGNAFVTLPVYPYPDPNYPNGHVAWALGTSGTDHDNNLFNTPNENGNRALDIYGVSSMNAVSLGTCDMCFGRLADGNWEIITIMMGGLRESWPMANSAVNLVDVTGVTYSAASGTPWIIARNKMNNVTGVWKSIPYFDDSGNLISVDWVNP